MNFNNSEIWAHHSRQHIRHRYRVFFSAIFYLHRTLHNSFNRFQEIGARDAHLKHIDPRSRRRYRNNPTDIARINPNYSLNFNQNEKTPVDVYRRIYRSCARHAIFDTKFAARFHDRCNTNDSFQRRCSEVGAYVRLNFTLALPTSERTLNCSRNYMYKRVCSAAKYIYTCKHTRTHAYANKYMNTRIRVRLRFKGIPRTRFVW